MKTFIVTAAALAALVALGACTEHPQSLGQAGKGGAPAWQGTADGFSVPGWAAGDQKSWESQLRERAQRGQDEYPRTSGAS